MCEMMKRLLTICSAGLLLAFALVWTAAGKESPDTLGYHGAEYIDLLAEEAALTSEVDSSDFNIQKVSADTGHLACLSISTGEITNTFPRFRYQGTPLMLRFENDVLTGYCETPEILSADKNIADVGAYLQNLDDLWDTDTASLSAVLAEYESQVSQFLSH